MNIDKHILYLKIAAVIAEASHAQRLKVGAVIEKDGNILSYGYNGTPAGFDNACEELQPIYPTSNLDISNEQMENTCNAKLVTKPEVLHAESNAITKCAKSTASSEGANLYLTVSPCFECCKLIIQAGIKAVYYSTHYRDITGLILLNDANIYHKLIKL